MDQATAPAKRLPAVGEVWNYNDGSPWPSSNSAARIVDVRNGWVRFDFCGFDRRCELTTFLACYMAPVIHDDDAPPCKVCGKGHCTIPHAEERL